MDPSPCGGGPRGVCRRTLPGEATATGGSAHVGQAAGPVDVSDGRTERFGDGRSRRGVQSSALRGAECPPNGIRRQAALLDQSRGGHADRLHELGQAVLLCHVAPLSLIVPVLTRGYFTIKSRILQ